MNQNYQTDPLLHNYLAPSYPLFIQLKYLINGLNAKKAIKNVKSDITYVMMKIGSWLRNWAPMENGLFLLL